MNKDLSSRKKFIEDHRSNFSVIAPAGVGKTTAIVKRIAKIITNFFEDSDQLLLVTYTQKAAAELLERTHAEIERTSTGKEFFEKIRKVFFGTIHELASKIIRENLSQLNLRADFKIEQDISSLWNDFSLETDYLAGLPEPMKNYLLTFIKYKNIHSSYLHLSHAPITGCIKNFPHINCDDVLSFKAGSRSKNIARFQNELKKWLGNGKGEKYRHKFPELSTKSQNFLEIYESTIMPLIDWAANTYGHILNKIHNDFLAYRLHLGKLTFDDLIKLANQILYHGQNYDEEIKSKKYSIILDEAQDTDPEQFKLLLGLIDKGWVENDYKTFPTTGRFCMVGDPQQSIYGDRTDVSTYLKIHNDLIDNNIATKLTFSITKRFSKNIAENINSFFPKILDGKNGQVDFVKLDSEKISPTPTPWSKIVVKNRPENENQLNPEIQAIKSLFSNKIPENFQVSHWSNIAILCPRKAWLGEIKEACCQDKSMPKMQMHSQDRTYADSIIFSWTTALLTCICEPDNFFEFAGILHEIFAIKDSIVADHFKTEKAENINEIESALEILRSKIYIKSISSIIEEIVLSFHLIDRILAISQNSEDEIFSTLDHLLTAANEADINNIPLAEFCNTLKNLLKENQPPPKIDKNALQLYTFHKSKGLEWEIVILPFLFRGKRQHEAAFPRLIKTRSGQKIAMNALQENKYKDEQKIRSRQNDERLVYVALTRQKSTAIFFDDRAIFQTTAGSTADSLRLTDEASPGFELFNDLAEFCHHPAKPPESRGLPKAVETSRDNMHISINSLNEQDYLAYVKISPSLADSNHFDTTKNMTPKELNGQGNEQGINYGLLWHETMNLVHWNEKNFNRSILKIIDEIDNERLALEVDKLINCAPFQSLIHSSDLILTEYSFFLPQEETTLIDGRIDMLLKNKNNLRIIDWKTDITTKERHFIESYCNQITLYGQALNKIFNINPEKYIYSTFLGKLIKI
ncbi:MAG: UvrD-helicase domain-containing protein [Puniceicoccales bacterium]|jgi:ATP-dependent exoDNAse (exonuclease V) beta subunit|nr:UvrD-helicase domain-containing protein [Puniceicoccales bacterium]